MVQLTIKPDIDQSKVDVLPRHELFSKTLGMWKNRDIDIKQIRQQARERRTNFNTINNDYFYS